MSENTNQIDPGFDDPAFDDPTFTRGPLEQSPSLATPIKKRAEEWQQNTDRIVADALLGVPQVILGMEMQPFTTARGSILRKIRNEFVMGVKLADIDDPFLSIGKFLIIMSRPLHEARLLVNDPNRLEEEAYDLMDTVHISEVSKVVERVNQFVNDQMSNQVHGSLPEDEQARDDSPKN